MHKKFRNRRRKFFLLKFFPQKEKNGAPVAMYLAAAGVGHIGLVDYDTVDLSNLQQQIIHQTGDLGKPKIEFADL